MKLFAKIVALFSTPLPPPAAPALYSDAEFLEAVMQQARPKTRGAHSARPAPGSSSQESVS